MTFDFATSVTYSNWVRGTWGSFATPVGRVDYVLTKARLGPESSDPERQLTKNLAPVREIMDVSNLDFNQLLQRDLDDHRVAVKLIPYLLTPQATSPAFFPPIVAALLPFHDNRPSRFPELEDLGSTERDNASWATHQAGSAFQVERLLLSSGEVSPENIARLRWNQNSEAKLVVLDGQHRAMALLAIERTVTDSWQSTSGARFRSFYENQVRNALKRYGSADFDLRKIEVPVAVCWFPNLTGGAQDPHRAARKLFVDVNRTARQPSRARIILLSDSELVNVLTRSMLGQLRDKQLQDSLLPLYSVEYDNPDVNSTRPARWSVVTNIHLFKMAVERCVFGPPKYLQDVTQKIIGRPSDSERDAFMQKQLRIPDLFEEQIEDGGFTYRRDNIGDHEFPLGKIDDISQQFTKTWGQAILLLLSRTAPYAAHAEALTRLKDAWHVDDTFASLAHDALFSGVGVYWTLRDSYNHYMEEREKRGKYQAKSDVVKAWEILSKREEEFEILRADAYLGSGKSDQVKASMDAFAVFNTHACQLGLVMTLGSLWELRKSQVGDSNPDDLPEFASAMVTGINRFFGKDHGRARDRRYALSKRGITKPINQIVNMDTPQAVYFRYFWLQILAMHESWEPMSEWLPVRSEFDEMLGKARQLYLGLCRDQQYKALKTSRPAADEKELRADALSTASQLLQRSLCAWFDVSEEEFRAWVNGKSISSTIAEPDSVETTEVEEEEPEGDDSDDAPVMDRSELIEED